MLLPLKMQEEVPETSPSTLLSPWVPGARFPHSSGALNQPAAFRIPEKLILNPEENLVRRAPCKLSQSLRERARFDEYHTVVYTTM